MVDLDDLRSLSFLPYTYPGTAGIFVRRHFQSPRAPDQDVFPRPGIDQISLADPSHQGALARSHRCGRNHRSLLFVLQHLDKTDADRLAQVIVDLMPRLVFDYKQRIESGGQAIADSQSMSDREPSEEVVQAVVEGNSADKVGSESDCSLAGFQQVGSVWAGMKDWAAVRIVAEFLVGIGSVVHSPGQGS